MSKNFALMKAASRLENHLSRERYSLNKMRDNERVSDSLMESKVDHFNELVSTLNTLFSVMGDSSELLFEPYILNEDDVIEPVILGSYEQEVELPALDISLVESVTQPEPAPVVPDIPDIRDNDDDDQTPAWKHDGYESEQAWLADKESESFEIPTDLSMSVDASLGKYRAEKVLNEYTQTTEQDIDSYMPEDDKPVSVLPSDLSDSDESDNTEWNESQARPTSDLAYLNHTDEGIRVDNDPTQIATVRTAVEREGANGNKGTEIDVGSYSYKSTSSVISNLIDDELSSLHINKPHDDEEEYDEPADEESDQEIYEQETENSI